MPERSSEPETDDLDATFRGLVDDVAARSHGRGADRAMRVAGARRTAVATGALVLVLIVAAGVGGWVLQGRRVGVPAVGGPSPAVAVSTAAPAPDVPSPARITLNRYNTASAGWVRWEVGTADVTDVEYCTRKAPLGPESVSDDRFEDYRVRGKAWASFEGSLYATRADADAALRATVADVVRSCPEKTQTHVTDVGADVEVVALSWGTSDRGGVMWMASSGRRMDTLRVVGVPRPSPDVLDRVSRLMAADVQVP